jgi:hypothetical protein
MKNIILGVLALSCTNSQAMDTCCAGAGSTVSVELSRPFQFLESVGINFVPGIEVALGSFVLDEKKVSSAKIDELLNALVGAKGRSLGDKIYDLALSIPSGFKEGSQDFSSSVPALQKLYDDARALRLQTIRGRDISYPLATLRVSGQHLPGDSSVMVTADHNYAFKAIPVKIRVDQIAKKDRINTQTIPDIEVISSETPLAFIINGHIISDDIRTMTLVDIAKLVNGTTGPNVKMTAFKNPTTNVYIMDLMSTEYAKPIDFAGTSPELLAMLNLRTEAATVESLSASFTVNSSRITIPLNEFTLSEGLTLKLTAPTREVLEFSVDYNRLEILQALRNFVSSYNNLTHVLNETLKTAMFGGPKPRPYGHHFGSTIQRSVTSNVAFMTSHASDCDDEFTPPSASRNLADVTPEHVSFLKRALESITTLD